MAGHWGDGKQKLRVAERCRSAPNTEFTTINLLYLFIYFFTFCLLFLWTRRSKITRNAEQKQTNEKQYYKSLSVTFRTETLNISWKITSIYSHWWVYDCCVEAGGWGGTSGAACRVVEFVVCVKMCGVCLWVSARVLSASGDMWRARSAGASTVSSLEKSERGKNKSSEVPDLNLYKKKMFPKS